MSILPYLFNDTHLLRPSRILDQQHFGLSLDPEEFLPLTAPRLLMRSPAGYIRNWRSPASEQDFGSTVSFDKNKFQANLDVQHFKPEEVTVKITGDNTITIEGKHKEKHDEHGKVYRHFVRKYVIPSSCDISKVESKLSSDGILTICAPRIEDKQTEEKSIPINQTGEPAKPVEKRCEKYSENKCEAKQCCTK